MSSPSFHVRLIRFDSKVIDSKPSKSEMKGLLLQSYVDIDMYYWDHNNIAQQKKGDLKSTSKSETLCEFGSVSRTSQTSKAAEESAAAISDRRSVSDSPQLLTTLGFQESTSWHKVQEGHWDLQAQM